MTRTTSVWSLSTLVWTGREKSSDYYSARVGVYEVVMKLDKRDNGWKCDSWTDTSQSPNAKAQNKAGRLSPFIALKTKPESNGQEIFSSSF